MSCGMIKLPCELQNLPGRANLESMGWGVQIHGDPLFLMNLVSALSQPSGSPCPAEAPSLLLSSASDLAFPCILGTEPLFLLCEILCHSRVYGPCTLVEDSL